MGFWTEADRFDPLPYPLAQPPAGPAVGGQACTEAIREAHLAHISSEFLPLMADVREPAVFRSICTIRIGEPVLATEALLEDGDVGVIHIAFGGKVLAFASVAQ